MLDDVLNSGAVIAGYRIQRVLGTGRMGTVYLASSPDLPRNDALKVLNSDLSHDRDFQVRFLREADIAAQLSHPNIVTVYRRGTAGDGLLWMAMQFVDGTDAETALRMGRMTPIRAIHIVSEIAKALDYAHRRHVIHRDVKPANFLLSDDSDTDERVLLGDFSISHSMASSDALASGSVLATVAYAAPEVLCGKAVDGRSDIYSLGCSLFRLLTGRVPYPGDGDTAAIIRGHLQEAPPRITSLMPDFPPALDGVIAKALAKDPGQRYQSAQELSRAAAAALHPQAVPATAAAQFPSAPPTPGAPPVQHSGARSRRRRNRMLTVVAALTGLAVVATVVVATRASHSRDSSDSRLDAYPMGDAAIAKTAGEPMNAVANSHETVDYSSRLSAGDHDCASVLGPAATSAYADTDYTDLLLRSTDGQGDPAPPRTSVQQAVIAYESVAAATKVKDRQLEMWQQCTMRRLSGAAGPDGVRPAIGVSGAENIAGGIAVLAFSTKIQSCGRAVTTQNNIVIDVLVCRPGQPAQRAAKVAADIAGRVH